MYVSSFSGGGAFLRLAKTAFLKPLLLEKSGIPLVWLSSCPRVTFDQRSGRLGRRSPMVSFRESLPLLTRERATPPLKALAALAMRMRSPARMVRSVFMLPPPKAWTSLCLPRCTTAIAPGGPPCWATNACSLASSAASAAVVSAVPMSSPPGLAASAIPLATSNAVAIDASSRTVLLIPPSNPVVGGDRSPVASATFAFRLHHLRAILAEVRVDPGRPLRVPQPVCSHKTPFLSISIHRLPGHDRPQERSRSIVRRRVLSEKEGQTGEQNLALFEQDLALFEYLQR